MRVAVHVTHAAVTTFVNPPSMARLLFDTERRQFNWMLKALTVFCCQWVLLDVQACWGQ